MKIIDRYKDMPLPARAAFWFMICSTLQQGIAILTVPIFTRILSADEYGLYSSYVAWENILVIFVSFRLDYTVFNKGMSKYKTERDGYVASMQLTTTAIAVVLMGIYCLGSDYFNEVTEMSTPIMILMIIQAAFYPAYSFWILRERYEYKIKHFIIVVVSMSLLNPIIGLGVIYLISINRGICRIGSYAGVYIAFGLALYFINIRNGFRKIKNEYIIFAIRFNVPMIPHYLSTYILNQSDRIMIQKMINMTKVAMYSVTYNAAMVMQIVSTSLVNALTPWYYKKLEENDIERVKKIYVPLMLCVIIPVSLFILLAPEVLLILASKEYSEAVYVIPPVTASIVFLMMYSFFSIPEFYYDANKFSSIISSFAAILNILLNYIGIKIWGYVAAGYTTMICYMIMAVGHYLYAQKVLRKKGQGFFDKKQTFLMIVFVISLVTVSSILYSNTIIRYFFVIICLLVIFLKKNTFIKLIKDFKSK